MTDYKKIKQFVMKNLNVLSTQQMYHILKDSYNYTSSFSAFKVYVSRLKKKTFTKSKKNGLNEIESKVLQVMTIHKVISIIDICDHLSSPPSFVFQNVASLASKGYEISYDDRNVYFGVGCASAGECIQKPLEENKEIIFGAPSDFHFGSKACQITALREFCEIAKKQGVKYMFVAGDVFAGFNVYRGQVFDLYAISSDEQEESTTVNLPTGFEWYMLGGNHDYSFIKSGPGHNPFNVLVHERKDTHYCGFDEAVIPLLKNVDLKMWHPSGGVPYALSYRLQKGIEQVAFSELQNVSRSLKERPTVRFVLAGHLHIQVQAMFGSIFGAQCGSFEGTNNLLKRKGIVPSVGGYIIKASLGSNGLLKCFEAKFHMFEEISNDWKNYNHLSIKKKIDKPVLIEK